MTTNNRIIVWLFLIIQSSYKQLILEIARLERTEDLEKMTNMWTI